MAETKRVFIAIELPEKLRRELYELGKGIRKEFNRLRVSYTKAEKIHLTLNFFGNVEESEIERLLEVLDEAARETAEFRIQTSHTGVFPNTKKPRVLWTGLKDTEGNLQRLKDKIDERLKEKGFYVEKRRFKPHLTVARLREPQKSVALAKTFIDKSLEPYEFKVSEIVLYESRQLPQGSEYSIISRHKFIQR